MIKLEDFKKLKQLDRIEFLLRSKHIEDTKIIVNYGNFFFLMFGIIGLVILLFVGLYDINKESAFNIFSTIKPLFFITIFGMSLMFLGNLMFDLITKKRHKELESEFFNFKIKPRK